ncbi:hypothetical protein [Thalassotalea litorea]|uniref:hypothetical protein n=1 Tax=Thalassotalea litorea TaxID=2020715 RepID=UPI00373533FF
MTTLSIIPRYYWESKAKADPHPRSLSVIPRHYWESRTKADPHFREDDGVGASATMWVRG